MYLSDVRALEGSINCPVWWPRGYPQKRNPDSTGTPAESIVPAYRGFLD